MSSYFLKTSLRLSNLIRPYRMQKNMIERYAYYSTFDKKKSYIVVSEDGQTIICWHPQNEPLYEHTKPLPEFVPEMNEGDSILKVQLRKDEMHIFKPDGPTIPELQKLTYTTKHRWYPNNKDRYLDPDPPVDRDGI